MRLYFFIFLFIPLFAQSSQLDLTDLLPPKIETGLHSVKLKSLTGTGATNQAAWINLCNAIEFYGFDVSNQFTPPSPHPYRNLETSITCYPTNNNGGRFVKGNLEVTFTYETKNSFVQSSDWYNDKQQTYYRYSFLEESGVEKKDCPPTGNPDYKYPYYLDGEMYCAKLKTLCPDESPNDILVLGTGQSTQYCFNNPDGTQCKITTNDDGDFVMPAAYASQESSICHNEQVESTDPDPIDDPAPIDDADPSTDSDNSQADDSDKSNEIDALNQVNDNLKIINDSINTASDTNSDRLDLIKDNIDNTNTYLDEITDSTGRILGSSQDQTSLLAEIRDGVGAINNNLQNSDDKPNNETPITATAERKTGGLNSLFTTDDLNNLKSQLDVKKSEYNTLYLDIENQIKQKFDFNINASAVYESHTLTAYGKTEEIGLSRFSDPFFLNSLHLLSCYFVLY